jgi:hypothetical protein
MGYLKEKHGMTMLGNTPPGTCPMCAVVHDPGQPHNQQSLAYQHNFYDRHGRLPTWADAMAHCTDEVKAVWKASLAEHGVVVGEEPEAAGGELEITLEVK